MNAYAQTLIQIVQTTVRHIAALDDATFTQKPTPQKWSKQEMLGHLIDSAYNNHQRFLRAEQQGNLVFPGYDPDDWVQKNGYQSRDRVEVLHLWVQTNEHLAHLINQLPDELMMQETRDHNFHVIGMNRPEEGSQSCLAYLVWDYLFHLEHHLSQIVPIYQKQVKPFETVGP